MLNRTISLGLLVSLAGIAACGDDETSTTTTTSSTSAASTSAATTGSGGSGGMSGTGGEGGGAGGAGGSGGGFADVDPIAGIGQVESVPGGQFTFQFLEGPIWIAKDGVLLFSDIPANRIYKLTPPSTFEVFREPSGRSNGLNLDNQGLLIACEHENRRISRTQANGMVVGVADNWQGMKLNSPNDVIIRSDGNIYFTDPPYGIPMGQQKELNFQGVFRVSPNGDMSIVVMDMNRPNGIALSPDESTLYVADSETPEVRSFPVAADGSTGQGKKILDRPSDGMAIDEAGNIYLTNDMGVEVFKPDGTKWGYIDVKADTTNVSFGGADRKTLYVTASGGLYRVVLNVPGIP